MARRRKAQLELEMDALPSADVAAQVTSDVLAASPVEPPPVTVWRVAKTAQVSLYGQITTLAAGALVSVAGYGRDGVARIAAQVELIPEA